MKMDAYVAAIVFGLLTVVTDAREITVSSSNCGGTYSVNGESLTLKYKGARLYQECRFTVSNSDGLKEICSSPKKFKINSCDTTIEYHNGYYSSYSSDKSYSCGQVQGFEHCTILNTLVVVFKNSGGTSTDDVELKLYESDGFSSELVDTVKTTVYVTIGVVVGVIVLVIIVTIVVICVCCRRRQSRPGQVYRSPQAGAVTTTVAYPMQGGYQPVQPGYQQPPPQGGYQPQPGFQPQPGYQPGAYPPGPQQGYDGYQKGPDTSPSAPPENMSPPPYPGN